MTQEMQGSNEPDFAAMDAPTLLEACGDDGMAWAKAFVQIVRKNHIDPLDEGYMVGWFANAIEHSHAVRHYRSQPATRPVVSDGFPASPF